MLHKKHLIPDQMPTCWYSYAAYLLPNSLTPDCGWPSNGRNFYLSDNYNQHLINSNSLKSSWFLATPIQSLQQADSFVWFRTTLKNIYSYSFQHLQTPNFLSLSDLFHSGTARISLWEESKACVISVKPKNYTLGLGLKSI